tara:strand:+ start:575 stop:805 length:231 start_codon:yes stop_codon:yes gene_type:complete
MKITNQWDESFEIEVGDWVGFKCDIEQEGIVKSIQRSRHTLIVENPHGFHGDYIGGDTEALLAFDDVWEIAGFLGS